MAQFQEGAVHSRKWATSSFATIGNKVAILIHYLNKFDFRLYNIPFMKDQIT